MDKSTDIPHELKIDLSRDSRETFIPLRHDDLYQRLVAYFQMGDDEANQFLKLCFSMQSIFHAEHHSALVSIEELYTPLDPDNEQIQLRSYPESEKSARAERLFDQMANLAYAAHYQRLSREELERMISISSRAGVRLEVDFDIFRRLEIFARGYRMVDVKRRRWQNLFREETIKLPEFHRLIMAFWLKDEEEVEKKRIDTSMQIDSVYIKNFKNIPETDLEVLLPGTKVKLSALDRGKILLPTIAGMGTSLYKFYRFLQGLFIVGVTITIISKLSTFILLIAATIGYLGKSVFAYFRTKDKHEFNLTKNLYLKNLDNNAGVLYRLLIEAQEQELCETTIGYAVLLRNCTGDGLTELELDELAEKFLLDETELDVDFDLHDALGKLARLGLANVDAKGRWSAVPLQTAPESLATNWERLFLRRIKRRMAGDPYTGNLLTDRS